MRLSDFQKEKCHHAHRFVQWWHARHAEKPEEYSLDKPHDEWLTLFAIWTADNPERIVEDSLDGHIDYMAEDGHA